MAYIANRPVRFDRDYAIGEVIPESVIDPKMTTKLINMGRIIRIADAAAAQETPAEGAEEPKSDDSGEGKANTHTDDENAPEGESDGTEGNQEADTDGEKYVCEICGKKFKSQNGLASHSRTHKK